MHMPQHTQWTFQPPPPHSLGRGADSTFWVRYSKGQVHPVSAGHWRSVAWGSASQSNPVSGSKLEIFPPCATLFPQHQTETDMMALAFLGWHLGFTGDSLIVWTMEFLWLLNFFMQVCNFIYHGHIVIVH